MPKIMVANPVAALDRDAAARTTGSILARLVQPHLEVDQKD